ncbi:MAG TPA: T9SS type A sorting domain-containing protein, partial [Ferruginibacter sp.]|nr:T9SS type A sorting domain-containing protein [Ferruginibacter sp.]
GATVSGASQSTGWVNGFLQKYLSTGPLSIAFETGDNTKFTPLSFQFDNVTIGGNLVARSVSGDHPFISSSLINVAKSVNRHWNLSNLGAAFTSYSVTAHYLPQDLDAGVNPAMFGLSLYNGSSWISTETGLLTDSASTLINATAINDLAIGEVCNKGTSIVYSGTPYCSASGNATVTVTGTTGGSFSSTTGLSINAATGLINLATSTPGSYSVNYTIDAGGECPVYITSANITIDEAPTADGSYTGSPYCAGAGTAYPTGSGTAGGIFSSTNGLVIDSTTGGINLSASTPGNYQVSYTIAASGGCGVFSWSTPVVISPIPDASIEYTNGIYCADDSIASVTLTGTTGGVYSSSPDLSINASTGLINIQNSVIGTYTVYYTIAAGAGCNAFQTSTDISIAEPGLWTGLVDTDWENAQNWQCGNLPNSSTNVTILNGLDHYPVISHVQALNNLVIEPGASIEVNGGTLQIAGSIQNDGVFNVSNGTVEMNGTDQQTIPANAFTNHVIKNLVISNDVVIAGTDTLTGTLSFGASNKILVTGDSLILKSNAAGTARIADITNQGLLTGNVISGKVIIERYIPAARGWRLLSVPVAATDVPTINAAWQEGLTTASANPNLYPGYGVKISGGTTDNGFDQSNTNASFIKTYDNISNSFVTLPANPGTNIPINSYPAYFLYIRGNRSINLMQGLNSAITDATLRIHGQVRTGTQPEPVSASNFTLIGNPYASAIDFGSLTRNNVQNTMYVWDPKLSGSYGLGGYVTLNWNNVTGVYDKTASVSAISQYIPGGEAFFVRSEDRVNAGTLTMKETDKTPSGSDQVFRTFGTDQQLRVNLFLGNADSSTNLLDGLLATFDDENNDLVDKSDALKMSSGAENISVKHFDQLLSIERRKKAVADDTLFVQMAKMKVRDYVFDISLSNMESGGLTAILQDRFLGSTADKLLNMNGSTQYSFAISSNAGSYAANRFNIVFKKLEVVPVTFTSVKAAWNRKDIDVEWKVENESGIQHYELETSLNGNAFKTITTAMPNDNSGHSASYQYVDKDPQSVKHFYRVRSYALDGRNSLSEIVMVNPGAGSGKDLVTIYPNPVIGNTLMLKLINVKKDAFTVQVFNVNGQMVNSYFFDHVGTESSYRFSLDEHLPAGKYQVQLSGKHASYVLPMIKK